MTTVADVQKRLKAAETNVSLFGKTGTFPDELQEHVRRLKDALAAQSEAVCTVDLKTDEARIRMPTDAELGPEAESIFAELKSWLEAQGA